MQVQFRKSEVGKKHTVKLSAQDFYILESRPSNWSEDCFIAVRKSAVDVVKDETTFRIGQRFRVGMGAEYILAQVDAKKVTFIGVQDGNYWCSPILVGHCDKVTISELNRLATDWRLS